MYHYAIRGSKKNVAYYRSIDILNAKPIEDKEEAAIPREELFNWEKRKDVFVEEEKQKNDK